MWVTWLSSFLFFSPSRIHFVVLSLDCSDLFLSSFSLSLCPCFRLSLLCSAKSRNFASSLDLCSPKSLGTATAHQSLIREICISSSKLGSFRGSHQLFWSFFWGRVLDFEGFFFCFVLFCFVSLDWVQLKVSVLSGRDSSEEGFGGVLFPEY